MTASGSRRRPRPRTRQRKPRGASQVGVTFQAEVGPIAHGGHHVVRHDGRVIFVRHALEGEQVVVQVTEGTDGDTFWRGDAIEILTASPARVPAPCPYAGPDACGGCDFQHVEVEHQRELKAVVVREQLSRLARLDVPVVVEAVPGDVGGLRWRTRQRYVELPDGGRGMRKHRSHEVVSIAKCLLEATEDTDSPHEVVTRFGAHRFEVESDGFWQVHPGAPNALVEAVLEGADAQPGESVLDLYAGVGLFSRFLADVVGESGRVVAVEGDPAATKHAVGNLAGTIGEVLQGDVAEVVSSYADTVDVVVLDPPRAGAKRRVVEAIAALEPRAIIYVACDPAALARDIAIFAEHGYALSTLRAFDLFPMTNHVECVALLTKTGSDLR